MEYSVRNGDSGFSTPTSASADACDATGFAEFYATPPSTDTTTSDGDSSTLDIIGPMPLAAAPALAPASKTTTIPLGNRTRTGGTSAAGRVGTPPPLRNAKASLIRIGGPARSDRCDTDDSDNATGDDETADDEDDDDDADGAGSSDRDAELISDFSAITEIFKMNYADSPHMLKTLHWLQEQMLSGANAHACLSAVLQEASKTVLIQPNVSDSDVWRLIAAILSDPPRRQRLQSISSIGNVIRLLHESKNIVVLTGAGVSVSCGIPDFRSRDGIYSRLSKEYPEIPNPQSMFDIRYFQQDPRPFYKFAKEIFPGQFTPSACHRFIRKLEQRSVLLRNYTQNIDTLERQAGIEKVIECHGSFGTASCTKCKHKVSSDSIRADILAQMIPMCPVCNPVDDATTVETTNRTSNRRKALHIDTVDPKNLVARGIMKPDIVFFGESLPEEFHDTSDFDKNMCDLLIVIGSSLKVRPVALIPSSLPPSVPQILINREQLDNFGFDVELLGDSDVIINQLCHMLGDEWSDICYQPQLTEAMSLLSASSASAPSSAASETQTKAVTTDKRKLIETAPKSMPLDENSIDTDSQSTGQGEPSSKCFMKMSLDSTTVKGTASESQNPQTVKCNKTITSILSTSKNRSSDAERTTESAELDMSSETSEARSTCEDAKKSVSFSDQMEHIDGTAPARRPKEITSSSKHPSITERLPANTYYCDPPNLYVFPGAEIWWDDDDESSYADDDEDDENDANDTQDDDDIDINCDENDETASKTPRSERIESDDDFSVRLNSIDDEMARQSPPSTAPLSPSNPTNAKSPTATKRRRRSSSTTRMDCGASDVASDSHAVTTGTEAISEAPSAEKKRRLCADAEDTDECTSTSAILTASMTSTPTQRCSTPIPLKSNDI